MHARQEWALSMYCLASTSSEARLLARLLPEFAFVGQKEASACVEASTWCQPGALVKCNNVTVSL
jgi:hypothetical protein